VIEPRDYQQDALNALRDKIRSGVRRICLVAPTGAGKTTVAGAMIHGVMSKGKRAIFLAHRQELIDQCSDRLTEFGVRHGVIQGNDPRTDPYRSVQVASVQTLVRRDHWDADLIIVDECHRSTSETYTKIIDRYDSPCVIGLTATPYRMDGRGLGEQYDDLHEVIGTQDLIDLGYLVNPRVYGSRDPVDLSGVKTTAGDYNKKDLAGAMSTHVLRGEIVKNWLNRFEGRDACTVVFAPSIEQSLRIVEQFRSAGVSAEHIDGSMSKSATGRRREVLRGLADRSISVVSNVGILTEGWDLPHLECVILARPTRSKSLYRQMVGRLMRPDPGKRFAYVLDHANCTRMHGFVFDPQEYSLEGRENRPRKGNTPAPHKQCESCFAMLPLRERRCSVCGHEKLRTPVEYTDEDLVELDPSNIVAGKSKASDVPRSQRQETFDKLCFQCIERGYKPAWARMRYNTFYGEWPSWQTGIRSSKSFRKYEADFKDKASKKLALPVGA
jgi:superfamily II DNA or RNA helicase